MRETAFTNARIVLGDEIVTGSLLVRDGKIVSGSQKTPGRGR